MLTLHSEMIKTIRHRELNRLFRGVKSRIGAGFLARLERALAQLDATEAVAELNLPGNRLHPLKGEWKGFWSITISANWRLVFRFEGGDAYDVDFIDYH